MRQTDIGLEAFIAARGLDPAWLFAAAGVTRQELDDPARAGEAAQKLRRCIAGWDRRHAVYCEGVAILLEAGDEVWGDVSS